MQDGCKVYMDSYVASNGSCFTVTWTIFQKPPLGGRPHIKPLGDHGTLNAHNVDLLCFIMCEDIISPKSPPLSLSQSEWLVVIDM